jgi:uncharacterized membrane protein YfcA
MSKTGISGVGLMVVPILANAFGGRSSVGLLLPILIFADILAVSWYNRHAEWKHILRLIPWALAGIITATIVGKNISDLTFNRLLAALVLGGIAVLLWRDIRADNLHIPRSGWFVGGLGLRPDPSWRYTSSPCVCPRTASSGQEPGSTSS